MSNVIPPLLSSSPPPMVGVLDEDEDDEFGDFAVATNLSYGCDAMSLPSSPQKTPTKSTTQSIPNIYCHDDTNNCEIMDIDASKCVEKDFQDKRKISAANSSDSEQITSASESSIGQINHTDANVNNLLHNNSKIKTNTDSKYNSFQYFPEIPPDIEPENDDAEYFSDTGNEFVEEFDNFQDFESSTSNVADNSKFVITDEIDVPSVECVEAAEHVLNGYKPNCESLEIDDCIKCDETKSECNTSAQSETNKEREQSQTVECVEVVADSTVDLGCKERLERTTTTFEQEPDEVIAHLPVNNVETKHENVEIEQNVDTPDENEDEFGDFENHSLESSQPIEQCPDVSGTKEKSDSKVNESIDDDFGDFESPLPVQGLEWNSDPFDNTKDICVAGDNFGDFNNQVFEEAAHFSKRQDEFGDFSSSAATQLKSDDVFGDFNDYSLQTQSSQNDSEDDTQRLQRVLSLDIEHIPQRAITVILEMFPVVKQSTEDYCERDFTSKDVIFGELKDVTDTSALLYQWSKSSSQHCLLNALSIDTRNILYGPRWNESMPRYAATLGFTPLEPLKPETHATVSSEPSDAASPSSQTPSNEPVQQTDIPSAQFDWVGSGLTNPLENSLASTMLLDLEQLVASLDIQFTSTLTPKSRNSPSPVNDIDDWEFWLRLTPKKTLEKRIKETITHEQNSLNTDVSMKISMESDTQPIDFELSCTLQPEVSTPIQTQSDNGSVKSLQLSEIQSEEVVTKSEAISTQFDEFTSFQSSKIEENNEFSSWPFNAVPLRETHIANVQSDAPVVVKLERNVLNSDEPGWLKPTILTPDLPRKTSVSKERQEEDEFADFQTGETTIDRIMPVKVKVENIKTEKSDEEDEFTDFQSTLPNALQPIEPLQPSAILEPLKPCILQPMVPATINWPDPGVSDDDLRNIELYYKAKSLNNDSDMPLVVDSKETSSSLSSRKAITNNASDHKPIKPAEEDDWSDFVSIQAPPVSYKVTKQLKQPSRTATPELQLCVPQLNQIQLPRKPVPVITQQGLIQTKLSSNSSVEPLVQPSVQQTKTYPQTSHLQNGFQPSLISNQFAAQFNQGFGYRNTNMNIHQNKPVQNSDKPKQTNQVMHNLQQELYHNSKPPQFFSHSEPSKLPSSVSSSRAEEFDDEWTDFVSSQPPPPVGPPPIPNGLHGRPPPKLNFDWNRPPQFTSWSANVTPNIITNPVAFDSFQSYSSPAQADVLKNRTSIKKNSNAAVQPKKSAIPSISNIPDLEFIAPKSRTWKK